ncbi:hypothetical protein [Clostridium tagluense]|uniref:Uncharacterized protein n=1 Tax=Clostridium tagluense TaxID=360422 RepID=A0A401UQA1_9CLOT|nr:hypothetical protein [Clostridium tagluense]GCD11691.1 hypothetical protein Ctaglu_33140 [Clostridium tagluense]
MFKNNIIGTEKTITLEIANLKDKCGMEVEIFLARKIKHLLDDKEITCDRMIYDFKEKDFQNLEGAGTGFKNGKELFAFNGGFDEIIRKNVNNLKYKDTGIMLSIHNKNECISDVHELLNETYKYGVNKIYMTIITEKDTERSYMSPIPNYIFNKINEYYDDMINNGVIPNQCLIRIECLDSDFEIHNLMK